MTIKYLLVIYKMEIKFILKVFIIVFLIFALIVFINTLGLNLNAQPPPKKLLQTVTLEGFDTSITIGKADSFCEINRSSGGGLDESCGKLTRNNCNSTSCCVWTSNEKCVAGDTNGPTFNSDAKGKTIMPDYYYFQNKCYGPKCPTE
jgi:hypothetical protein